MRESRLEDLNSDDRELLGAAEKARGHAYAPYSHYKVGAAVRSESGKIFSGCNVEYVTYSQTTHAEQNAIDQMVAVGERKIQAVSVIAEGSGIPCGLCRQAIWEFSGRDKNIPIIASNLSGRITLATIGELYPEPFGPEAFGIKPEEEK